MFEPPGRLSGTSVCGLTLLVYVAFRPAATSLRVLELLWDVYQAKTAWEPMHALMKRLNGYMREQRLSLQALSPLLAGLRDTRIPMPGLGLASSSAAEEAGGGGGGGGAAGGRSGSVTVASVEEQVLWKSE